MEENKLICNNCGCIIDTNDYEEFDEQILCSDCLDELTTYCDCCGSRIWREEMHGDEYINLCGYYYQNHHARCSNCDGLVHEDDVYAEEFLPMVISGRTFTDRKEAGEALIQTARSNCLPTGEKTLIGSYRGFEMSVHYDAFHKCIFVTLEAEGRYPVEMSTSPHGNVSRISSWLAQAIHSSIKAFESCAYTLYQWKEGILNSFDCKYTNGFAEGCNNKIKVLKRNAYGYRNFDRFRNRILHMFSHQRMPIVQSKK